LAIYCLKTDNLLSSPQSSEFTPLQLNFIRFKPMKQYVQRKANKIMADKHIRIEFVQQSDKLVEEMSFIRNHFQTRGFVLRSVFGLETSRDGDIIPLTNYCVLVCTCVASWISL
jgi:hypothetical protein